VIYSEHFVKVIFWMFNVMGTRPGCGSQGMFTNLYVDTL
jgi:hypothetical protein